MGSSAATSAGRRRAAARRSGAKRTARAKGPGSRGSRSPGRSRTPRPRKRSWIRWLVLAAAAAAALAAGYFLWLRDSPLVAVADVTVEGVETSDRRPIVRALTRAGETMTTLNVDSERLDAVAARFPTIESVSADASFPRSLTIRVVERPPALVASVADREVPIAADGTVLRGIEVERRLPRIDVDRVPKRGRLRGEARTRALVAAAAPEPLAPLIRKVRHSPGAGVEVRMRGGITLRFGSGASAEEKWAAAAAVLADPQLESVSYLDVRVPRRPAVGDGAAAAVVDPAAATGSDPTAGAAAAATDPAVDSPAGTAIDPAAAEGG